MNLISAIVGFEDFPFIGCVFRTISGSATIYFGWLTRAAEIFALDVNDLDRDENLLNTPEGTFDLKKGLAGGKAHDSKDYITKMTTCAPGDKGKQLWEDALKLFFCGDQQLIDYVQMVVGMAAIGKVYQEHLIIAYGGGANGKSTFWNTIFRVMGNYAGKVRIFCNPVSR